MCTQEHNTDNRTQTLLFGCSDRSRALIQESLIPSLSWDSPGPPSCLPVFPLFLSYIVRSVAIRSERKRGMKCCFVSRRSWREGGKERMRECEECGGVSKWLFRELWSVCGTLLMRVCVCVCVCVSECQRMRGLFQMKHRKSLIQPTKPDGWSNRSSEGEIVKIYIVLFNQWLMLIFSYLYSWYIYYISQWY